MLNIRRVVGDSMQPTLKPGQIVLAIRSNNYSVMDIVIAKQNGKEVIKRIALAKDSFYSLVGDNTSFSSDSRKYGAVNKKDILGRVILVI